MPTPPDVTDLNWPASADDDTTLFGDPVNLATWTLNGSINASVQTFVVSDPNNILGSCEAPFFVRFATGEICYVEAIDAGTDTLSSVTRAVDSTAQEHSDGEVVRMIPTAQYFIQYKGAILALQTELGTDPAGSMSDLKTRLAVSMNDNGTLKEASVTAHEAALTIALTQLTLADWDFGGYGITNLDRLDIDQTADADAIQIFGYDDKAADYLKLNVAATGDAYFHASYRGIIKSGDNVILQVGDAAGAKFLKVWDSGGVTVFKIDSDGAVTVYGTIDMNSQELDNLLVATFTEEIDNGNSGAADTIDWGAGQKQKSTMTADCTYTFTAPNGVGTFVLKLVQDATGAWTPTWPASVKWVGGTEPSWTSTANGVDIISFYYDGTTYWGSAGLDYS